MKSSISTQNKVYFNKKCLREKKMRRKKMSLSFEERRRKKKETKEGSNTLLSPYSEEKEHAT